MKVRLFKFKFISTCDVTWSRSPAPTGALTPFFCIQYLFFVICERNVMARNNCWLFQIWIWWHSDMKAFGGIAQETAIIRQVGLWFIPNFTFLCRRQYSCSQHRACNTPPIITGKDGWRGVESDHQHETEKRKQRKSCIACSNNSTPSFPHVSSFCSLSLSHSVPLSLLSSISSQLSLTVYLAHTPLSSIQADSPGNATNLIPTRVCSRAGWSQRPRRYWKPSGSASQNMRVTASIPQWEDHRFSLLGLKRPFS